MRLSMLAATLLAFIPSFTIGADDTHTPKPRKPCTIKSPTTGLEFDLSGLTVHLPKEGDTHSKDEKIQSWPSRGYDYGVNYTMNICAPVVEELEDVVGVQESLWKNVSAFYISEGKTFSMGQAQSELLFRGRKLVLNYTDGSPCDTSYSSSYRDHDDDKKRIRRKSMVISFLCDKDTYESSKPKVALSIVSASPDFCFYSFEARTPLACGGVVAPTEQAVGPGSLFGIIMLIALAVYIFGGIAYQRNVMHQRGWRQIPNYSIWAGIAEFCKDMVIILFSSCTRCIPKRRGYNQLPTHNNRSRGTSREDENRLIDQLDEEWED